jgi:NTP pyrophosphatase (non-canonical NTP hydrolase)
MTINEYQKAAMRTANPGVCDQLPNVALGLCGESGEIADMVKKAEYQGHELDKEHIAKELGDVAWYLALGATTIGYDLETILQMNVDKLKARYPEGFDPEKSNNRKPGDV